MAIVTVENHGPLVVASSYWGSDVERAGKLWCTCNAGAIRILVPRSHRAMIQEWRSADYAILSRGPWPEAGRSDGVEILWEDHTDSPFALHLGPESFDLLPAEPPPDRQWIISVWDDKKGRPHKALERPCHWRRVPRIPWMKPWRSP